MLARLFGEDSAQAFLFDLAASCFWPGGIGGLRGGQGIQSAHFLTCERSLSFVYLVSSPWWRSKFRCRRAPVVWG